MSHHASTANVTVSSANNSSQGPHSHTVKKSAVILLVERLGKWDDDSILIYSRFVCACFIPIGIVVIIAQSIQYKKDLDAQTKRDDVDHGSLWNLVTTFIFLVSVAINFALSFRKGRKFDVENRIALLLQASIYACIGEFTDGLYSYYSCIALCLPLMGVYYQLPFKLYGGASLVTTLWFVLLFLDREIDFGLLHFEVNTSAAPQIVNYVIAMLHITFFAYIMSFSIEDHRKTKKERDAQLAQIAELLASMNTKSADSSFASLPKDAVTTSLQKLTKNLARFRPYLPYALIQKEAGEAEEERKESETTEGDEPVPSPRRPTSAAVANRQSNSGSSPALQSSGTNADPTAQKEEEKTQVIKKRCTVLHAALMNLPTNDVRAATEIMHIFAESVIPKIEAEGGMIENLSASSIVGVFNAFTPCVLHERAACRCALAIAGELSLHKEKMFVAIAVSAGYNLTGSCGIDTHRAKFVAGEGVDLVFKLPSLMARHLSCSIAVTEDVANSCGCEVAPIDTIEPHWFQEGRSKTITLYELRSSKKENTQALMSVYALAFTSLRNGDYAQAANLWKVYCESNPPDNQAARLHALTLRYAANSSTANCPYRARAEWQWEPLEGTKPSAAQPQLQFKQDESANEKSENMEEAMQEMLKQGEMELDEGGLIPVFVTTDPQEETKDAVTTGVAVAKRFPDVNKDMWQRSEKKIGSGAFSDVYMGLGAQGNLVAMKCFLRAKRSVNPQELMKEVDTLSHLRNDYIVGYVSCALMPNHFVILMEYVSGGSLRELLDQFGPLPLPAVRRYLKDILRGLQCLHEHGITHCDIKPHNALLSNDGTCKLSDFGSAVNGQNPGTSDGELNVRGTSWYMSPQAARGEIRPSNDIWSVGVTLIELLHGKQPWVFSGGENRFVVALSKDDAMVPPIPTDIPPDARIFAESCFKRRFEDRPTVVQLLNSPFLTL